MTTVIALVLAAFVLHRFIMDTMDLTQPDDPYAPQKDRNGS